MRRVLSIFAVLILAATSIFAQEQGKSPGGLHGGRWGAAAIDTIPIIQWSFTGGMPADVTEVGNVSVVTFEGGKVLKINVEGGGEDKIQQTIPSCNEYWLRKNFRINAASINGWADNESMQVAAITEVSGNNGRSLLYLYLVSGELKWRIRYYDDDGNSSFSDYSSETVSTDTWYSLFLHFKKSTASGADNGIITLAVDGTEVISVTDWDNEAAIYALLFVGWNSNTLDAIYYIDPVQFWSREGLP